MQIQSDTGTRSALLSRCKSRPGEPTTARTYVSTCLCMQATRRKHVRTFLIGYRSGGTPYVLRNLRHVPDCGPLSEKAVPASTSATSRLFVLPVATRRWVLKLPENHKLPTAQELQGRLYCKWNHSFTHATNDCKELRRQIQSAIEQGRLILAQHTMKVDSQPFPTRLNR